MWNSGHHGNGKGKHFKIIFLLKPHGLELKTFDLICSSEWTSSKVLKVMALELR